MSKPFKLSIVSDVREVLRGNQDIERSLDDVADSLDDLARESKDTGRDISDGLGDGADDAAREVDRAADKIGDSLESAGDEARDAGRDIERHIEDGTREAESAAEKMERTFRDAFDGVKREAKTAGDDVGTDTKRGFREAESATDTFRDEARSNLSESLSSFRGEVEEIPDLIQGVFGGVTADLGTGGLIGAGLVAAGAGLAIKFYEDWKEQTEKVEERVSDMYEDMLESGENFLSTQYLNEAISEIINTKDGVIDLAEAQEIAAAAGLDFNTVVRGYAGEAESAQQVQDALNERIRESNTEFQRLRDEGLMGAANEVANNIEQFRDYGDTLAGVTDGVLTATEQAELYRGAQLAGSEAVREHVEALAGWDETLAGAREQIEENNDTIDNNTERYEQNRGVLSELIGEMLDLRESAREAGAGTADLTALQAEQADQFLDTAAAAGIEEDAALDLAEQLGLIPEDVATDIRENGAEEVKRKAREVRDVARAVAREDYTVNLDVGLPSRHELQSHLNRLVWGLTAPAAQVRVRYGQSIA